MTQLTTHFALSDLTASEVALRKGLSNEPDENQIEHLKVLAAGLERVRALLGPFHINSAFRSAEVNAAVGGSPHSAHLEGYAADIVRVGFSPKEVCEAILRAGIPCDQLIKEGGEHGWTHISFAPTMRNEVLTARFDQGRVTYTAGLA